MNILLAAIASAVLSALLTIYYPALVSGAEAVLLGGTAVYTWYLDLFR